MNQKEYPEFAELWEVAHEVMPMGRVFSENGMMAIISALNYYSIDSLRLAIQKHIQIGKFAPCPKDIIDLLEAQNKRMSADEAWAICNVDESETIIWTEEMREAYGIASNLKANGDTIGARMAFRGAYDRICNESMLMGKPVRWCVSIGLDKELARNVIKQAAMEGKLSREYARVLLPAPMEGGIIAGLITGKITELPKNNENLKTRWKEISQALADGQERMAEQDRLRLARENEKRLEFQEKKLAAAKLAGLIQ